MDARRRLKIICYFTICLSFAIIWLDWVLLLTPFKIEGEHCEKLHVTIFGAGSLFGYVPLLTGVATLKKHGARRGLLLATAISSVILAVYDFSEAIAVFNCNAPMGILFAAQGAMSSVIIILSGVAWISIGWWNEAAQNDSATPRVVNVTGQNDHPPNYDRAIRDPDSMAVRMEASVHRTYHRFSQQMNFNSFRSALFVPGRNLERLSMGISVNTIGIVVLQVVVEVLRVSARSFEFQTPYHSGNVTWTMWCNEDINVSCIAGLGYYCTMPPFFLIIFGIQFRVTRRGLNIPGWFGVAYAAFSFLTFLTLTALAMMDFVVLIGMIAFNKGFTITEGNPNTAMTILICAESLTVIQALLSIACAALAMVASYILTTQIVEKNRRTRRRQRNSENNITENNTEETIDQGIENVAYETDENDSISDPKLPSYSMASNMLRRHNSLPNLYKANQYQRLPGMGRSIHREGQALRRTNSTNLFDHNPEEPPPYRDRQY